MKNFSTYSLYKKNQSINESVSDPYKYHPKDKYELFNAIQDEIRIQGTKANLNCIDVSLITDMSDIFYHVSDFNGDISEWDVSNVVNMKEMFYRCRFNNDISGWNVSNVKYMRSMFDGCDFNQDISDWDVSNVEDMCKMFSSSDFNGDISRWDVSRVEDMRCLFDYSKFTGDISRWDVHRVKNMHHMFDNSQFKGDISDWDVSNVENIESIFDDDHAFNCPNLKDKWIAKFNPKYKEKLTDQLTKSLQSV